MDFIRDLTERDLILVRQVALAHVLGRCEYDRCSFPFSAVSAYPACFLLVEGCGTATQPIDIRLIEQVVIPLLVAVKVAVLIHRVQLVGP